jgi:prepilin-type N-terminal cleavage/methylation domain-containing protein
MRKQAGFTMVEFMIAMVVTLVVLSAAVAAFMDTAKSNQRVSASADMNDNLRTALNLVRQDIVVAGEGIPTGGIAIPSGAGISINRPGPIALTFPQPFLPAITLGTGLGPKVAVPTTTATMPAANSPTDEITLVYGDNTLGLDQAPINLPAGPSVATPCNGSILGNTSSLTFDPSAGCLNLAAATFTLNPGDLILLSNINGTAIQTVTSVSGQVVNFAKNNAIDKFGLNQTGATSGTLKQIQNKVPNSNPVAYDGTYPPTTATRIWMVSYYLDTVTDPTHIRLVRQINFNQAQPVAEIIEALTFRYNFVDQNVPPTFYSNSATVPAGLTENNIRAVNLFLGARASSSVGASNSYLRDNMQTQISVRSLNYYNKYK